MLPLNLCVLSIKGGREGVVGQSMKRKRRRRCPQKRSQRGRGLFKKAMAYNRQPMRLPPIGGYLGAKMALKVLGPKAQKQFAPFMNKFKKVAFI